MCIVLSICSSHEIICTRFSLLIHDRFWHFLHLMCFRTHSVNFLSYSSCNTVTDNKEEFSDGHESWPSQTITFKPENIDVKIMRNFTTSIQFFMNPFCISTLAFKLPLRRSVQKRYVIKLIDWPYFPTKLRVLFSSACECIFYSSLFISWAITVRDCSENFNLLWNKTR